MKVIHSQGYNHFWNTIFPPEGKDITALAKALAELKHLTRVAIGPVGSTPQDDNLTWIKGEREQ